MSSLLLERTPQSSGGWGVYGLWGTNKQESLSAVCCVLRAVEEVPLPRASCRLECTVNDAITEEGLLRDDSPEYVTIAPVKYTQVPHRADVRLVVTVTECESGDGVGL